MERTPSTPYSQAGGLTALGGSLLVVGSMFLPWADTGGGKVDYWHLTGIEAVRHDSGAYLVTLGLVLLLAAWCALYFTLHTHETRMVWAFGGFTGTMILYGADLRISEEIPAGGSGAGEVAAAIGLLLLVTGCVMALAANVPEPAPAHRTGKASL